MSATKKYGLGRGLDALLADPEKPEAASELDILAIDPNPNQPRRQFDEEKLNELRDSIMAHGVLQPLLVVRRDDRYLLVAGERRWRAARLAGLKRVPALVRDYTDQQIAEIALVENLQRDDLNALDEAEGIRSLLQTFELTQEQVAERLSMSRPAVTNALRLLGLPTQVQNFLRASQLSAGHARALAGLEDEALMGRLALQAVQNGLSVREMEELVRRAKLTPEQKKIVTHEKAPIEFREFEEKLMHAFGTKVKVKGDLKRGSIVVSYYNREDLERLYALADRLATLRVSSSETMESASTSQKPRMK